MFATAPLAGAMPRTVPMTWWAALSVGAAAIHFAVIPEHFEEWVVFGLAFAVLGWFQVMWPLAHLDRPSRRLAWLAIAVNLGTVVVWVWSRTIGLPVGPEPGMPETIGAPDLVASAFELALVVGLLATQVARPGRPRTPATGDAGMDDRPNAMTVLNAGAWILVVVLSTMSLAMGAGAG